MDSNKKIGDMTLGELEDLIDFRVQQALLDAGIDPDPDFEVSEELARDLEEFQRQERAGTLVTYSTDEVEGLLEGMSTDEAAEEIGVSARRIQAMIKAGQLEARKVGRVWIIEPDSVERERDRERKAGRPQKAS